MLQLRSIQRLAELDGSYDAVLCDAWGVIHNGLAAKARAIIALEIARSKGIPVIVLTNAPRTQKQLIDHFRLMGVRSEAYDKIISSGEVGRDFISKGKQKKCYHLGPNIDRALFERTGVELVVNLLDAEFIFNSGLRDNTRETPENYNEFLNKAQSHNLPMICVNPDRKVHIGKDQRACAGALAEIYESLGGKVTWLGKPYRKIYKFCEAELEGLLNKPVAPSRILAIGDGLSTDILGAKEMGYQTLFVLQGVHAEEFIAMKNNKIDQKALAQICAIKNAVPNFVIPELA